MAIFRTFREAPNYACSHEAVEERLHADDEFDACCAVDRVRWPRTPSDDAAWLSESNKPQILVLEDPGLAEAGRRDWTRTNDPHHVKVVL